MAFGCGLHLCFLFAHAAVYFEPFVCFVSNRRPPDISAGGPSSRLPFALRLPPGHHEGHSYRDDRRHDGDDDDAGVATGVGAISAGGALGILGTVSTGRTGRARVALGAYGATSAISAGGTSRAGGPTRPTVLVLQRRFI